jgi:hypothetical protein
MPGSTSAHTHLSSRPHVNPLPLTLSSSYFCDCKIPEKLPNHLFSFPPVSVPFLMSLTWLSQVYLRPPVTPRLCYEGGGNCNYCWLLRNLHSLILKATQSHWTPAAKQYGLEIWTNITKVKNCAVLSQIPCLQWSNISTKFNLFLSHMFQMHDMVSTVQDLTETWIVFKECE